MRPEEDAGDLWLVGGQAIENQTQVDVSVDPTSVEATKLDDPCFCTIMDGKERLETCPYSFQRSGRRDGGLLGQKGRREAGRGKAVLAASLDVGTGLVPAMLVVRQGALYAKVV